MGGCPKIAHFFHVIISPNVVDQNMSKFDGRFYYLFPKFYVICFQTLPSVIKIVEKSQICHLETCAPKMVQPYS